MSLAALEREPLTEVVFGVGFDPSNFTSVHYGLYWQTIRNDFPSDPLDRPPLGEIELLRALPPLRRVWFESEDKNQLIQLQSDRFYYNWRRQPSTTKYPHYEDIYPKFLKEWARFQDWWLKEFSSPMQSNRYELTYLNQIDERFGWKEAKDHQNIFNIISESWNKLPLQIDGFRGDIKFILPQERGDLVVSIDEGANPTGGSPFVVLNLTARSNDTDIDIEQWFGSAHESIVETFASLLSQKSKEQWGFQWLK